MTTLSWQETRGILLELESLYRDGSDAGSVIRGETAVKAFLTGSKQRCSDAKRSICQLANEAENKENLAKEIDVEDEASRQFEEQKVEADIVQEEQSAAQEVDALADGVPRVQNAISLYATITGIQWDYDALPGTHRGWIPNNKYGTEAILPFEFDEARTAADRFRIANSLWSMIDGKQPEDVGAAPCSTCSYLR
eukprot:322180_1